MPAGPTTARRSPPRPRSPVSTAQPAPSSRASNRRSPTTRDLHQRHAAHRPDPTSTAPSTAGTYTVLASFAGSTDYASRLGPGQLHHRPGHARGERHRRRRHLQRHGLRRHGHGHRAQRLAASSLEGITPSLAYYTGTYSSTAQLTGLTSPPPRRARPAPTRSWPASPAAPTTPAASALANFTIAQATPSVSVTDSGGTTTARPSPRRPRSPGSAATPSSLEGVTPSLAYYSGTYTSTAQLTGLTPRPPRRAWPAPTRSWPASPAAPTTPGLGTGQLHHRPGHAHRERHRPRRHLQRLGFPRHGHGHRGRRHTGLRASRASRRRWPTTAGPIPAPRSSTA